MGDVVRLLNVDNPFEVYLTSLDSAESRRTMATCIKNLQGILGRALYTLVPAEVGFLRNEIRTRFSSPNTQNKYLSALRGYLKTAHRLDAVGEGVMRELAAAKNFKGTRTLRGRMLSKDELSAMVAQTEYPDATSARDAAMLACLRAGLRRAEVVALDMADVDLTSDNTIKVTGKGNKQRLVPLPEGGRRLVLRWLVHRGTDPGPLLCRTDVPLVRLERLSTQTIYDRVAQLWTLAGGSEADVPSPHDFRRTLASELLDLDVDPHTVQEILGHALLETTMQYDRRPDARKKKAMDRITLEEPDVREPVEEDEAD